MLKNTCPMDDAIRPKDPAMTMPFPDLLSIVTPRLVLRAGTGRCPAAQTGDQACRHCCVAAVCPNEPEVLHEKIERIRRWRSLFDRDEDYVYGIFDPEETRVVGGTGLHKRVGDRAFEIGYWIDREMINRGLATEVSAALVKVSFEILNARRVEIHCDPLNHRSAAVPKKLGFTHEATLRERHPDYDDVWSDLMIWSIFKPEYIGSPCKEIEIQAFDSANRRIL